ncbi:MAG: response regulator [Beijerinckiaceae bacterium]
MQDRSPIRVLYIDDDSGLARLIQRTLEPKGFIVEHATSGSEGLRRVEAGGIDVVALDHYLPDQTGLMLLPRIRQLPDAPPVIYVTGSDDIHVAVSALKEGAADYVWKDTEGQFRELLGSTIDAALQQERLRKAKEQAEAETREARDRAELSLREVNHRVANSLQLVGALVRLQASSVSDPAARSALEETQGRINAIAGVHRHLYTSDDVRVVNIATYLASLVEELEASMRASGRGHAIRLSAEPLQIPTDKAVSVGVIVTELVTNAYKYAYPMGSHGDIRVNMARQSDGAIILAVEDDGMGVEATDVPRGSGLGTKIINAMAANLKSSIRLDEDARGTRISLPLYI